MEIHEDIVGGRLGSIRVVGSMCYRLALAESQVREYGSEEDLAQFLEDKREILREIREGGLEKR